MILSPADLRLSEEEVRGILQDIPGVFYTDKHFVYAGLNHGEAYINLRKLLGRTTELNILSSALAADLLVATHRDHEESRPLVLAGAETLGRDIAILGARAIGVDYVYISSEKDTEGRKTYHLNDKADFTQVLDGADVILVDDLGNEGSTMRGCINLVREYGGDVLGAGVIVNRNPALNADTLGIPHWHQLVSFNLEQHLPEDCPFCRENRPVVTDLGRGREFAELHPTVPTCTVLS